MADAELGNGALTEKQANAFWHLRFEDMMSGRLPEELTALLFEKQSAQVQQIDVLVRPLVFTARAEHGKRSGAKPYAIAPLITRATVDREGSIRLDPETRMARDVLTPLDRGAYTIGSMAALDAWLTRHVAAHEANTSELHALGGAAGYLQEWSAYRDYCHAMLNAVCTDGWPANDYALSEELLIEKDEGGKGATMHLLPLYDDIREKQLAAPLFDRFTAEAPAMQEP
ncbi:hypothetical protein, partial [Sphingomonas azotifigens]|uniref:hypothetical protein n=1 Tax=Sphingomonas azotifigens TaxID=330920 RepID=UPI001C3FCC01